MKYIIASFLMICVVFSCKNADKQPTDMAGKIKLLREKEKELRTLTEEVEKLRAEVETNDTMRKEKPRTLVTTQKFKRKDFARYVEIQGGVQSSDVVMASSEMPGRLVSMAIKEGDFIKKGQLIGSVDLESVNKQIAELEKSLELAREMHERQRRLWQQNIGSEMQYLQAKNNQERLEKTLETVRFQLTKANFYAPISGIVDRIIVKQGEVLGPGTPVLQILNVSRVKVIAEVPEMQLKAVKKGDTVKIKFPAIEQERTGRISNIGRVINPANRTFSVEVEMDNSNGVLKPNLMATMLLADFTQKNAVVLPVDLVQQEISGKNYVFVKSDSSEGVVAKRVYVELGESYENEILITAGLTGDEDVIIDGARSISDNESIEIQSQNPIK